MSKTIEIAQDNKRSLLKYFAIMLASCVVLQLIIAERGSHIDLVAYLLTGCIALYYGWYQYFSRAKLSRLRFGRLVAHIVGFLTVNLSFHLHAFILFVVNSSAIRGSEGFAIDPEWFGVLIGMTTVWGLGLLIHLVASIANRGFEELNRT